MMGCFPCSSNSHKRMGKDMTVHKHSPDRNGLRHSPDKSPACLDKSKSSSSDNNVKKHPKDVNQSSAGDGLLKGGGKARTFTFKQLLAATEQFNPDNFLGEGGFGPVYRGKLEDSQIVAIKQLDLYGVQGIREFIVEVMTLSLADHPNLVKLIGYCAEGDQRLLVYEYMPLGSLEEHLHGCLRKRKQLDWNTRMKIAAGAAKGLQYLHEKMNPPIIYRDLKCSNILLDEGYKPKLSDFGLAKVGPVGDKTHVSTRVMGTYGYCAPDYAMTGQLTAKADIYSFGVVLLELITGRRAIDPFQPNNGQTLVSWARPLFKDRKNFPQMADPVLKGQYPMRGLYQALAISAMCIQEQASLRPLITDIVTALDFLSTQVYVPQTGPQSPSPSSSERSNSSLS